MSSLISNSDAANLTGLYGDFFDSFKKQIVIYKEPLKTAINASVQPLYGYDTPSNETNYTYTHISGVFYGTVSTSDSEKTNGKINDANVSYNASTLKLKVEKDAKDFINEGRTEKIEIEGRSYNVTGSDKRLFFLTKEYFIFELQEAH